MPTDETNRRKVEMFFDCFNRRDFDGIKDLLHDGYTQEWPQSGERIRGYENQRAVQENYPGLPDIDVKKVHGSEDRWLTTPSYTLLRVTGTGDQYTAEQRIRYPSGEEWWGVAIMEFRDGRIIRLTNYFGPPFPPAEWRAPWVELMAEPATPD